MAKKWIQVSEAVSRIQSAASKLGWEELKHQRSPRSNSIYLKFLFKHSQSKVRTITVRISDHPSPDPENVDIDVSTRNNGSLRWGHAVVMLENLSTKPKATVEEAIKLAKTTLHNPRIWDMLDEEYRRSTQP